MPRPMGSGDEREISGEFKPSPWLTFGFVCQCCIYLIVKYLFVFLLPFWHNQLIGLELLFLL